MTALRPAVLGAAMLMPLLDARCQDPRRDQPAQDPRAPALSKGEIAQAVDEYLAANPPFAEPRSWEPIFDRLTLVGDLRLRSESDFNRDDRRDRHRQRIRLRFGADYRASDEITLGARLVTGDPDDPNSPHVTLGNAFDSFEVSLDRAFVSYRPQWAGGASFTAGKFNHPFARNPVYGELVWDADVQPEGAILGWSMRLGQPFEDLTLTAGAYPLLEQNNGSDAFASVYEARSRVRFGEDTAAGASVAFYHYTELTPNDVTTLLAENAGNATVDRDGDTTADAYASNFGILHPTVNFTYEGWQYPLSVAAEYVLNTRAMIEKDRGWALGVAYGSTQKQGDWRAYYQWQVIEQDALFAGFAQDDFLFSTNHRSHILGVDYQLLDDAGLHVWALASAPDQTFAGPTTDSDDLQWRFRIDLNVKF